MRADCPGQPSSVASLARPWPGRATESQRRGLRCRYRCATLTLAGMPGDLRQGPPLLLQLLYSVQLFQVLLAIAGRPTPDQRRRQQPPVRCRNEWCGPAHPTPRTIRPKRSSPALQSEESAILGRGHKVNEPRPLRAKTATREVPFGSTYCAAILSTQDERLALSYYSVK